MLAGFRQLLWLARKLVSLRLALLTTGAALLWPIGEKLWTEAQQQEHPWFMAAGCLSPLLLVLLYWYDKTHPLQHPRSLSPEARRIMEALDRLPGEKYQYKSDEKGYDITNGVLRCKNQKPKYWSEMHWFTIDDIGLSKVVPMSNSDRDAVLKRANEVCVGIMEREQEKAKQAALAKLGPAKVEYVEGPLKVKQPGQKDVASQLRVEKNGSHYYVVVPEEMQKFVQSKGWYVENGRAPFGDSKSYAEGFADGMQRLWNESTKA